MGFDPRKPRDPGDGLAELLARHRAKLAERPKSAASPRAVKATLAALAEVIDPLAD